MESVTYRRCQACATINENRDYCKNCGALINLSLKRQIERERSEKKKTEAKRLQEPDAITKFFNHIRHHRNPIIRGLGRIVYSVWVVIFGIGAFLAYLIGYIAA